MKIVSGIVSALISGAANANSIVQFGKFREKNEQKDKKTFQTPTRICFGILTAPRCPATSWISWLASRSGGTM